MGKRRKRKAIPAALHSEISEYASLLRVLRATDTLDITTQLTRLDSPNETAKPRMKNPDSVNPLRRPAWRLRLTKRLAVHRLKVIPFILEGRGKTGHDGLLSRRTFISPSGDSKMKCTHLRNMFCCPTFRIYS
jgi:hypothetical protein